MRKVLHACPEPIEFEAILPPRTDGVDKVQTSLLKCQERRWSEEGWPKTPRRTLRLVIDDEATFNFRPYSFTPPTSNILSQRFDTIAAQVDRFGRSKKLDGRAG